RTWKQLRCPSTEERIRKMWYMYTIEYYTAEKNNDIMKFAGKWVELENVILESIPNGSKILILGMRTNALKLLEKNIGCIFQHTATGRDFLKKTLVEQEIKPTIDKQDQEMKTLLFSKGSCLSSSNGKLEIHDHKTGPVTAQNLAYANKNSTISLKILRLVLHMDLRHCLQANMFPPYLNEQCNDGNAMGFPNCLIDAVEQCGIPVDQVELHGKSFNGVLRVTWFSLPQ
ncbi:hypothetical protein STEG23_011894, partial [Scotinomys teguina]